MKDVNKKHNVFYVLIGVAVFFIFGGYTVVNEAKMEKAYEIIERQGREIQDLKHQNEKIIYSQDIANNALNVLLYENKVVHTGFSDMLRFEQDMANRQNDLYQ